MTGKEDRDDYTLDVYPRTSDGVERKVNKCLVKWKRMLLLRESEVKRERFGLFVKREIQALAFVSA